MTAEAFLKNKGDIDFRLSKSGEYISDIMIEFAKYHVEKALKSGINCLSNGTLTDEDEDKILNAYPLTNIE